MKTADTITFRLLWFSLPGMINMTERVSPIL
jgi:hypothetical protein